MNPGEYIYNTLSSDVDIAAMVGTRIRPQLNLTAETTSLPYIVYTVDSNAPTNMKGTANGISKLDVIGVTISFFHNNYESVVDGGTAVRRVLDYAVGTGDYDNIQHVSFQGEGYEFDEDYKPRGLYILNQSYQFRIKR